MLREQAQLLRELQVRAGKPSLRTIAKRASALFATEGATLPPATQSALFNGRYTSLDKLMWLIRTLMSWDKFGRDCEPPDYGAAELDEWHDRWTTITTARPARRRAFTAASTTPNSQSTTADSEPSVSLLSAAEASLFERARSTRHQGAVFAVKFSSDGRRLATGSSEGIRLWNAITLQPDRGLGRTGSSGEVLAVGFSSEGHHLAIVSDDSKVQLWDSFLGEPVGDPLTDDHPIRAAVISADNQLLATARNDGGVRLWNLITHEPVDQPFTDPQDVTPVMAFSPDGRLLATGVRNGGLYVWDSIAGEMALFAGHPGPVSAVAFSPDGRFLATGSDDGSLWLWETATGAPASDPLTGPNGGVFALAFSPDGGLLAAGGRDGSVRLWDPTTGDPVSVLTDHQGPVSAVAFSPDGRFLATGSDDRSLLLYTRRITPPPVAAKTFALRILSRAVQSGRPVSLSSLKMGTEIGAMAFSPDGLLLTSDLRGGVELWDPAIGMPANDPLSGRLQRVYAMAFSADGRLLATGHGDGTAQVWDPAAGEPVGAPLAGHQDTVRALAFSANGRLLVTGYSRGSARLWNLTTQEAVGKLFTGEARAVAFSPDGRILATAGSDDGSARLWNPTSGELVSNLLVGHRGAVRAVGRPGRHRPPRQGHLCWMRPRQPSAARFSP
jgi:WD40 repeat protein